MDLRRHRQSPSRPLSAALALAVALLGLLSAGHGHAAPEAGPAGSAHQHVSAPVAEGAAAPACPVCALLYGATSLDPAGRCVPNAPGLDTGPTAVARSLRPHGPSIRARSPRGPPAPA